MFIAIYTFTIIPGKEADFEESWAERTIEIKASYNSLGSRLHKAEDGTYVGYAQWHSKEQWESLKPSSTPAGTKMRSCCSKIDSIFQLDVVRDLLERAEL